MATDQLEVAMMPLEAPALPPLANLPSGTVTFLFTDIEDSTRLWSKYPDRMSVALARHDTLLREAIERHGGAVFKTVGDAFHAAFVTATDALAAALAAQRALQAERWEQFLVPRAAELTIRVRMALHTGTAEAREGDYFGHTLSRVARILAAGHGAQVLLSAATWELLRDQLPPGVSLRDLGVYRLKGLPRPEQIYQLVAPELLSGFSPLVTLNRLTTNLPVQTTAFIGREREVTQVSELMRRSDVRLVTLTGPGGTGKTRLALRVAAELFSNDSPALQFRGEREPEGADLFPDGVWFINLAPISDPNLVSSSIAQALELRETAGQPILDSLKSYLSEKRMLLVLDNFEQIVDAATMIAELLLAAPGLKTLVTRRASLHLSGEHEFAVPPLSLPDHAHMPDLERLTQYEAVRLFIGRAQAVKAEFAVTNENAPAVAQICMRLDGLPLAIELAAARIKLFPPQALLRRLDARLKFLTAGTRDLPPRQQTIRNTIDWSYDLLNDGEKQLFARLGVFVDGCTLQAADAICNTNGDLQIDVVDRVTALVDKSLVQQKEGLDDEPRFVMLETIREYALERLAASGEAEVVRRKHAEYYLELAETAERSFAGPEERRWMDALEAEFSNLRAAIAWSLAGDLEIGAGIIIALDTFWEAHGHRSEAISWTEQALAEGMTLAPSLRAELLSRWADHQRERGSLALAVKFGEEGLVLARASGDKRVIGHAIGHLGSLLRDMKEYERARSMSEEALALLREIGDKKEERHILNTLRGLAKLAVLQGDLERGWILSEEITELCRRLGDAAGVAESLNRQGEWARFRGDYARAAPLYEECIANYQMLGYVPDLFAVLNLGFVNLRQGEPVRAQARFREALVLALKTGSAWNLLALGIAGIAGVLLALQATPEAASHAARLLGAALLQWERIGVSPERNDARDLEWFVATARAQLGEEAFAAAWAAGRALTLEQAVAEALGEAG
jgi:predicted ATPase/class 3 adenylate cyclase